jgi:hypothetical protein
MGDRIRTSKSVAQRCQGPLSHPIPHAASGGPENLTDVGLYLHTGTWGTLFHDHRDVQSCDDVTAQNRQARLAVGAIVVLALVALTTRRRGRRVAEGLLALLAALLAINAQRDGPVVPLALASASAVGCIVFVEVVSRSNTALGPHRAASR